MTAAAGKKVLIVDSEMDMRIFLARLLEAGGYSIIMAADGEEGMEKASREKPDLIVLDVMMTPQGGLELFDDLKLNENLKNIPVVLLSTLDERTLHHLRVLPVAARDWSIQRPDGILPKPPEAEELLEMLRNLAEPAAKSPEMEKT